MNHQYKLDSQSATVGSSKLNFTKILKHFAATDRFRNQFNFIVYAHENQQAGDASATNVHRLIEWLQAVGSQTISDKNPLRQFRDNPKLPSDSNAVRNILGNQIRLLPKHTHSVDKVIVCGSEVLENYCHNHFATQYIQHLENLYEDLCNEDERF
ncbi:hypothetical protein F5Y02DRAFT_414551 [Annulohypoxylon stygium]|nr:hypothetical protein F5Y02DRAFT_414551 [Annulohypoxylon stygium]